MTPSFHGLRALHHRLPTSGYALFITVRISGFALPMTPSYHGLRALHHRLPTSGYALSTPNMSNGRTSRPATGHALSTLAFLPHASRSACFFFKSRGLRSP